MKKIWLAVGVVSGCAWLGMAQAAPGEWWEITTKSEMQGMPFAMPAQTSRVCIPKGGEADPNRTLGKDSNCKMTDVQSSGNTVKFKGSCVNNGETMNMEGQTTHDANSFKSSAKMTGKSHGEPINMTMNSSGKRVGGACDTEELTRKAESQSRQVQAKADEIHSKQCEMPSDTVELLRREKNYFNNYGSQQGIPAPCAEKKEQYCKAVRSGLAGNFKAYMALERHEDRDEIVKVCKVDVNAVAKTMCKSRALKGPQEFLDKYCPSEAKSYRELMRKMDVCAERGYTAGDELKKCMNGPIPENDEPDSDESSSDSRSSDSGSGSRSSDSINADSVLQGAKKLKGLFGF